MASISSETRFKLTTRRLGYGKFVSANAGLDTQLQYVARAARGFHRQHDQPAYFAELRNPYLEFESSRLTTPRIPTSPDGLPSPSRSSLHPRIPDRCPRGSPLRCE